MGEKLHYAHQKMFPSEVRSKVGRMASKLSFINPRDGHVSIFNMSS